MSRRRDRPVDIGVQPSGSEMLSVRLPSAELERIEAAATRDGVTLSAWVRRQLAGPARLAQVQLHPPTQNPASVTWLVTP